MTPKGGDDLKITKKIRNQGIMRAEYPFFEKECDHDNAEWMNALSEALLSEISAYCTSELAGMGSLRYRLTYSAEEAEGIITVKFVMALEKGRHPILAKTLHCKWKDGLLAKAKAENAPVSDTVHFI